MGKSNTESIGIANGGGPTSSTFVWKTNPSDVNKWKCDVCSTKWDFKLKKCGSCGAPRPGVTQEELDNDAKDLKMKFLGSGGSQTTPNLQVSPEKGFNMILGTNNGSNTTTDSQTAATKKFSFGAVSTGPNASSATSIFGTSLNNSNSPQTQTVNPASSLFGNSNTNRISLPVGSIFGAGAAATTSASTGGFRPSVGPGGGFRPSLIGSGSSVNLDPKCDSKSIEHIKKKSQKKVRSQWRSLRGPSSGSSSLNEILVFGSGECDQLGLGDDIFERKKPAPIQSLTSTLITSKKQIIQISCGALHTLALVKDSYEIYSWGCNDDGALGRLGKDEVPVLVDFFGTENFKFEDEDRQPPKRKILRKEDYISGGTRFTNQDFRIKKIAAGDSHSVALTEDGNLFLWGVYNNSLGGTVGFPDYDRGSIGNGKILEDRKNAKCFFPLPMNQNQNISNGTIRKGPIPSEKIVDVKCGSNHTVILTESASVFTWGDNYTGALGIGSNLEPPEPPADCENGPEETDPKKKKLWSDYEKSRKLYKQKQIDILFPQKIVLESENKNSSNNVKMIGTGPEQTFVITKDDKVYGCGLHGDGQIGIGAQSYPSAKHIEPKFREILALSNQNLSMISGGCSHVVALAIDSKEDPTKSKVFSWGRYTLCGLNQSNAGENYKTPQVIPDISFNGNNSDSEGPGSDSSDNNNVKIVSVSAGGSHSVAINSIGEVYTWGSGISHQCGTVPFDIENYTEEEKDKEPETVLTPYLVDSKHLKNRFVIQAEGGSCHTVLLAWENDNTMANGNLESDSRMVNGTKDNNTVTAATVANGTTESTSSIFNTNIQATNSILKRSRQPDSIMDVNNSTNRIYNRTNNINSPTASNISNYNTHNTNLPNNNSNNLFSTGNDNSLKRRKRMVIVEPELMEQCFKDIREFEKTGIFAEEDEELEDLKEGLN